MKVILFLVFGIYDKGNFVCLFYVFGYSEELINGYMVRVRLIKDSKILKFVIDFLEIFFFLLDLYEER